MRRAGADPAGIDDVLMGCANQAGEDNRNVARMSALLAGLPVERAGGDGQPVVRVGIDGDRRRGAGGGGGGCGAAGRGRGRVDVAGAAGDGEGAARRFRGAT